MYTLFTAMLHLSFAFVCRSQLVRNILLSDLGCVTLNAGEPEKPVPLTVLTVDVDSSTTNAFNKKQHACVIRFDRCINC